MTERERRERLVLVNTIPLPPEESKRLVRGTLKAKDMTGILAELVRKITEEFEARYEDTWDEVAKLAGYASLDEVIDSNLVLYIDRSRSVIEVRSRDPIPAPPDDSAKAD